MGRRGEGGAAATRYLMGRLEEAAEGGFCGGGGVRVKPPPATVHEVMHQTGVHPASDGPWRQHSGDTNTKYHYNSSVIVANGTT